MTNVNTPAFLTSTVAVAGTATQLPNQRIPDGIAVLIRALRTNTGIIKIGNSAANAQAAESGNNFTLLQGQSIALQVNNTQTLFIDASVAGEGVSIVLEQDLA